MEIQGLSIPQNQMLHLASEVTSETQSRQKFTAGEVGLALSDFARLLGDSGEASNIEWGSEFRTIPPMPHSASELNAWFQALSKAVQSKVEGFLSGNGVDLTPPVALRVDHNGELRVVEPRSDLERIETLLNSDKEIPQQVAQLQERQALIGSLEAASGFQQAAERNPEAAMEQYSRRLSKAQIDSEAFQLLVGEPATTAPTDKANPSP